MFAYRANRSVDDAVNMGLHYVLQYLDRPGAYVRILFVDFSSACNSICVCVCVCVYVCACRMFVPICICALDPGLYKNVKHFRSILGLLFFFDK